MNNKYKIFFYYWFPVILYCFMIFKQSSGPAVIILPVAHSDKLLHIIGYSILAILFCRAFRSIGILDIHTLMLLNLLSSVFYGFSDEIHQYFVPCRSADINDFLADVIGSFLGFCIYHTMINRLHNHRRAV